MMMYSYFGKNGILWMFLQKMFHFENSLLHKKIKITPEMIVFKKQKNKKITVKHYVCDDVFLFWKKLYFEGVFVRNVSFWQYPPSSIKSKTPLK